ncbi:sugar phosphate isomerase/epimerase family protein [Opitutus terrae]|uniref:Xylose isomerase domain protein TIM barrel n=1 Tax=Opitutus terrae (strain DSM 11246 / JCM 15787 / PB90-1) TaxID=452637 RepID=B1ZMF3_OPITP|nr:sugar phosphate isomerase/epimerase family protein [Opitutus terrae]ACB73406.1 Xylose isomerase domain protein TIM barrel [Opitutus terrae PB90-1]
MFASLNPGHVGIRNLSFEESLVLAERHGFGGLDVQLVPLHEAVTRHGADAVRAQFFQHGLQIGAWNLPFMPYRGSESEWRAEQAKLPPLLASAGALGARRAGMWIMPGSDDSAYEENFAFHVTRFQPIAAMLADHGIRLGLEFIGPLTTQKKFKHPFVRSLREILDLARAIGPNCGVLIDAWHWHCAGGTREDLRVLTRELLVHVHVDDAPAGVPRDELIDDRRKLPCTTGVIDIDGFMQALTHAGYDGPVTAEPFDADVNALPADQAAALTAKTTREAVARAMRR